jgi:hypothetical protein
LQEQLAVERQQRQEEAAATRASIEQHRIELRRCVPLAVREQLQEWLHRGLRVGSQCFLLMTAYCPSLCAVVMC